MAKDWRTPIDMNDWMRNAERRMDQTERRPVPGLQTPATFAKSAIRVNDWNFSPATMNGFFYSGVDGLNSPVDGDSFIGNTIVDPEGFGVQMVTRYRGGTLGVWARQFTAFGGAPTFDAWESVY